MPPTRPYPSAASRSTAAWTSATSKATLRRPSSFAIAAGDPGSWSGRTKLDSSSMVPPPGGRSMTISVRTSGMPVTVSTNSPSTKVRPSTSRPSPTKNAVTASRSATVIPTWSKRLMSDTPLLLPARVRPARRSGLHLMASVATRRRSRADSQLPHGCRRDASWPPEVNWPQQIRYFLKEATMETTGNAVPVTQSAADGTRTSLHSSRKLRRGALGAATALLVCLAAASPALAAGHSTGAPTLRDWDSSSSQSGSGTQSWESPYGSGSSGSFGAGATSQPATAAESAGVVLIDTVLPYQHGQAAGTGMVLTSNGQVLTNYHVVQGSGSIRVTVAQSGDTYQATVVGSDRSQDVALLQLAGASDLTTIKADTDDVTVGEQVTAVGNAGGTGTLSAADGTITGLGASVTAASEDGTSPETLGGMVETDANVLAGDSGGPLFDAQGEVVGIDTAGSSGGAADAYAIPIARALEIAQEIQSGHETSTVRIGPAAFLGVEVADAASYAGYGDGARGGFATTPGAQVSGVVSGAAAANAGLQTGDVITSLNGQAVSTPDDVSAALVGANPGDNVTMGWTSPDGSQHEAPVTLGASPVA